MGDNKCSEVEVHSDPNNFGSGSSQTDRLTFCEMKDLHCVNQDKLICPNKVQLIPSSGRDQRKKQMNMCAVCIGVSATEPRPDIYMKIRLPSYYELLQ